MFHHDLVACADDRFESIVICSIEYFRVYFPWVSIYNIGIVFVFGPQVKEVEGEAWISEHGVLL